METGICVDCHDKPVEDPYVWLIDWEEKGEMAPT
jgi:hypothetical protein